MPNNGRAAICPYYIGEHKQSITCEDIVRRHVTPDAKRNWKASYCCSEHGWGKCPYAKALNDVYAATESMSPEQARLYYLVHVNEVQRGEIMKLLSALGHMSNKIERINQNGNKNRGPVSGDSGAGKRKARNREKEKK